MNTNTLTVRTLSLTINRFDIVFVFFLALVFLVFAIYLTSMLGGELIRSDSWRFLDIFANAYFNRGDSFITVAASDQHFELLNTAFYLIDYKFFELSFAWQFWVSHFVRVFSYLILAIYIFKYYAISSLWGKFNTYLIFCSLLLISFPSTDLTVFSWNLVAMGGIKLPLLCLYVLHTHHVKVFDFRQLVITSVWALILLLAFHTFSFLFFLAYSLTLCIVIIFKKQKKYCYLLAAQILAIILCKIIIQLTGFSGVGQKFSIVYSINSIINFYSYLSFSYFSPFVDKNLIKENGILVQLGFVLILCLKTYVIFKYRNRVDEPLVTLSIALFGVFVAVALGAAAVRFGFEGNLKSFAFTPRYSGVYLVGFTSSFLLFISVIIRIKTVTCVPKYIVSLSLIGIVLLQLSNFYSLYQAAPYTKNYFNKMATQIVCVEKDKKPVRLAPTNFTIDEQISVVKQLKEERLNIFNPKFASKYALKDCKN